MLSGSLVKVASDKNKLISKSNMKGGKISTKGCESIRAFTRKNEMGVRAFTHKKKIKVRAFTHKKMEKFVLLLTTYHPNYKRALMFSLPKSILKNDLMLNILMR